MKGCCIKSKTNAGEFAKQYFHLQVYKDKPDSLALIVRKLVLTTNTKKYNTGYKMLKKYKDKYLYEQYFSIKMSTLNNAMTYLLNN